jgi:hypothetical protein
MHWDAGIPASEADEWLWTCIECEAEEQEAIRFIATMTGDEAESMSEEQFEALLQNANQAGAAQ